MAEYLHFVYCIGSVFSDPIPAEDGPSLSIHKSRPFKEEDVMLSPRMTKLKKKIK